MYTYIIQSYYIYIYIFIYNVRTSALPVSNHTRSYGRCFSRGSSADPSFTSLLVRLHYCKAQIKTHIHIYIYIYIYIYKINAESLQPHHKAMTADGQTVLDKSILQHSSFILYIYITLYIYIYIHIYADVLAASKVYRNMRLPDLGELLEVAADKVSFGRNDFDKFDLFG